MILKGSVKDLFEDFVNIGILHFHLRDVYLIIFPSLPSLTDFVLLAHELEVEKCACL